jgi:outer membrane biosynthesis protein TonB
MRDEPRSGLAPSALASLLLHALVLGAGLIVLPWFGKPVQIANVTAITLTPAPPAPPPPALQAPEAQTSAAPEPTPRPAPPVPPTPAPEPPKPTPQPPKPAPPKPQPAPTPAKPTPTPPKIDPKAMPKPAPAKPRAKTKAADSDFLSSLTTSLDKSAASQTRQQSATRGPPRTETAPTARIDPGAEQATADAASAVGARLNRIWNKSCGVEGFRDLVIHVKFNLTPQGALQGAPQVLDPPQAGNGVWQAAADRAVRAVVQAAPFAELPRQTYGEWKTFTAIFNGKEACQNQ